MCTCRAACHLAHSIDILLSSGALAHAVGARAAARALSDAGRAGAADRSCNACLQLLSKEATASPVAADCCWQMLFVCTVPGGQKQRPATHSELPVHWSWMMQFVPGGTCGRHWLLSGLNTWPDGQSRRGGWFGAIRPIVYCMSTDFLGWD